MSKRPIDKISGSTKDKHTSLLKRFRAEDSEVLDSGDEYEISQDEFVNDSAYLSSEEGFSEVDRADEEEDRRIEEEEDSAYEEAAEKEEEKLEEKFGTYIHCFVAPYGLLTPDEPQWDGYLGSECEILSHSHHDTMGYFMAGALLPSTLYKRPEYLEAIRGARSIQLWYYGERVPNDMHLIDFLFNVVHPKIEDFREKRGEEEVKRHSTYHTATNVYFVLTINDVVPPTTPVRPIILFNTLATTDSKEEDDASEGNHCVQAPTPISLQTLPVYEFKNLIDPVLTELDFDPLDSVKQVFPQRTVIKPGDTTPEPYVVYPEKMEDCINSRHAYAPMAFFVLPNTVGTFKITID